MSRLEGAELEQPGSERMKNGRLLALETQGRKDRQVLYSSAAIQQTSRKLWKRLWRRTREEGRLMMASPEVQVVCLMGPKGGMGKRQAGEDEGKTAARQKGREAE